jgi:peptidyl-prolyl cis-trans isomerase SurA
VIAVVRRARLAVVICVAASLVSTVTMAQDAPENLTPLNIPSDVKLLGPRDPSIRKATAIVNGTIITDTDVDQRLALVLAANQGRTVDAAERERLRAQVISNVIDETLQIQEAAANKITVDKAEIDDTFLRIATQFKRSPADFAKFVREQGSSEASMKRQIEGELAWRRLLSREVEPFVSVSDEEVNAVIDRMKASKGAQEYDVGEIFLSATPATQDQVTANAERIVDQIRKGGSFVAYARQYSEASTAAAGGRLGWVRAEQLPEPLAAALAQMAPGQVSNAIPVGGGYSIIALLDKRQVLTADPRDTVLALKQMTITFAAGTTQEAATPRVSAFASALKTLQGCGSVTAMASRVGAEVVDNDGIKIRDFPPQLQQIMQTMRVGEVTPPFGSVEEGVRALIICGRDEPEAAGVPSFDAIQNQMSEQRVNLRAQRYLRDLRRDAVIDYR